MDNGNSPVQPLDSTGGTDPKLANLLASAKEAGGGQTPAPGPRADQAVPDHLCPNCLSGRGAEVELEASDEKLVKTTGKCGECGYDATQRLYF